MNFGEIVKEILSLREHLTITLSLQSNNYSGNLKEQASMKIMSNNKKISSLLFKK